MRLSIHLLDRSMTLKYRYLVAFAHQEATLWQNDRLTVFLFAMIVWAEAGSVR
jgi:hypothetical protein